MSSSGCTSTSCAPWTSTSRELSPGESSETRLFTVGHSTRSLDELVALLKEHGIRQLVDVRHYPRSRRNPQANLKVLEKGLPAGGIAYAWDEDLGGLREGGYQAYMTTPRFAAGMRRLERLARMAPTVIMCAEARPMDCHRRFIARQLAARGYRVTHIVTGGKPGYGEPLSPDTEPT